MAIKQAHNYSALKWLKGELDETIREARRALEEYVEGKADPELMASCAAKLHQVHGILQIVQLYGASQLAEEMEQAALALGGGKLADRDSAVEALVMGMIRLPDYLEQLQAGGVDSPLALLPMLNDLRVARGAEKISELSLFAPQLDRLIKVKGEGGQDNPLLQKLVRAGRVKFQQGLLLWIRGTDPVKGVSQLRGLMAVLEGKAGREQVKRLFRIARAALSLPLDKGPGAGAPMKKLIGRVDRELKQIADGGESAVVAQPPVELLRQLLYYIAVTECADPLVQEVRQQFQLAQFVSATKPGAKPAVAAPNLDMLKALSAALGADLTGIKDSLDLFIRSRSQDPEELGALEKPLRKVADTLSMAGQGSLRQRLMRHAQRIKEATQLGKLLNDSDLMEMAGDILFVETSLENLTTVGLEQRTEPPEEGAEAAHKRLRLPAGEYEKLVSAVIHEVGIDMRKSKEAVLSYLEAPESIQLLSEVPGRFRTMAGAFDMLKLFEVSGLLRRIAGFVSGQIIGRRVTLDSERLNVFADAITSIEYFMESVAEGRGVQGDILRIAEESLDRLGATDAKETLVGETTAEGLGLEPMPPVAAEEAAAVRPVLEEVAEAPPAPHPAPVPEAVPSAAKPALQEIDSEILEIFVEEAREVLATIRDAFPRWRSDRDDRQALTIVRRSFHTLKGSGRLVGAAVIGELAWSIENLLNRVIDETVRVSPDILQLLDEAVEMLPGLIESQATGGRPENDAKPLMEKAFRLAEPDNVREAMAKAEAAPAEPAAEAVAAELPGTITDTTLAAPLERASKAEAAAAPALELPAAGPALEYVDPEILEVFLEEAQEVLESIQDNYPRWRSDQENRDALANLRRSFHTLKGSGRMAGALTIGELAWSIENLLNKLLEGALAVSGETLEVLNLTIEALPGLIACQQEGRPPDVDVRGLMDRAFLLVDPSYVPAAPEVPAREAVAQAAPEQIEAAPLTLFEVEEEPPPALAPLAEAPEEAVEEAVEEAAAEEMAVAEEPLAPLEEVDPEILEIFVEEAREVIGEIKENFPRWRADQKDKEALTVIRRSFHTLKGSGRMAGALTIGELAWSIENLLNRVLDGTVKVSEELLNVMARVIEVLPGLIDAQESGSPPPLDVRPLREHGFRLADPKYVPSAVAEKGAPPKPSAPAAAPEKAPAGAEPARLHVAEEVVVAAPLPKVEEIALGEVTEEVASFPEAEEISLELLAGEPPSAPEVEEIALGEVTEEIASFPEAEEISLALLAEEAPAVPELEAISLEMVGEEAAEALFPEASIAPEITGISVEEALAALAPEPPVPAVADFLLEEVAEEAPLELVAEETSPVPGREKISLEQAVEGLSVERASESPAVPEVAEIPLEEVIEETPVALAEETLPVPEVEEVSLEQAIEEISAGLAAEPPADQEVETVVQEEVIEAVPAVAAVDECAPEVRMKSAPAEKPLPELMTTTGFGQPAVLEALIPELAALGIEINLPPRTEVFPPPGVSEEVLEIFVEEARDEIGLLHDYLPVWRKKPGDTDALETFRHVFATLTRKGQLIGAIGMTALAGACAVLLERVSGGEVAADAAVFELLGDALERLQQFHDALARGRAPRVEYRTVVARAQELAAGPVAPPAAPTVPAKAEEPVAEEIEIGLPEPKALAVAEAPAPLEAALAELAETAAEEIEIGLPELEVLAVEEAPAPLEAALAELAETAAEEIEIGLPELEVLAVEEAPAPLEAALAELAETAAEEIEIGLLEPEALAVAEAPLTEVAKAVAAEPAPPPIRIDPVLLKIFTGESNNHLTTLERFLDGCAAEDASDLVTRDVARAFHTLHGSSVLAEVIPISTLSSACERLVKELMVREMRADPRVHSLFRDAIRAMREVLACVNQPGAVLPEIAGLVKQANRLCDEAKSLALPPPVAAPVEVMEEVLELEGESAAELAVEQALAAAEAAALPPPAPRPVIASVPVTEDPKLVEIFLEEAQELVEQLDRALVEWGEHPTELREVPALKRTLHTLKGSARLAGILPIGDLSHAFETLLEGLERGETPADDEAFSCALRATDRLVAQVEAVRRSSRVLLADDLLDELRQVGTRAMIPAAPVAAPAIQPPVTIPVPPPPPVPTPPAVAVAAPAIQPPVPVSPPPKPQPPLPGPMPDEALVAARVQAPPPAAAAPKYQQVSGDPELVEVFLEEAQELLEHIDAAMLEWGRAPEDTSALPGLKRTLHTLKGSSRLAGILPIGDLSHAFENLLDGLGKGGLASDERTFAFAQRVTDRLVAQVEAVRSSGRVLLADDLLQDLERLLGKAETPVAPVTPPAAPKPVAAPVPAAPAAGERRLVKVQSDPELLDAFLEEARDLLEALEQTLQQWRAAPEDSGPLAQLQRTLHTLKGSSRLAGILAVGDLSHAFESLLVAISHGEIAGGPESLTLSQLVADRLAEQIEEVRGSGQVHTAGDLIAKLDAFRGAPAAPAAPPQAAPAEQTAAVTAAEPAAKPAAEPEAGVKRAPAREQVRVNPELLDKLVNFSGEISIYRARIEQQNSTFGFNLAEMAQTVHRLRNQLRQLEIENEAQILFRIERDKERSAELGEDFDPLEFDRFSTMQQLSRSLMETVTDLSSLNEAMELLQRNTDTLLLQQSRISADLQDGLMRTRMVPVSQTVARLRRVVRQTADSVGKKADLEVAGTEAEIDRNILERMVGPIEHLLRNSISHGVEAPEQRRAIGKPEMGRVHFTLSREGNDVIIEVGDDGAGLNLEKIRQKAIKRGLLKEGAKISDDDLMQFVLEHGFSTADQVSQVAGRGVGMDVVVSEVKQLGGDLRIRSQWGKGATFVVRLPLTLAVTDALLMNLSDEIYAVPHSGIEGVVRISRQDLLDCYEGRREGFEYAGNLYRVRYLGGILGTASSGLPETPKWFPMLLVKAAEHRVALQVDSLLGNREIVVKSLGPQLSGVRWLSGGTILADGRVVLILDVSALVRMDAAQTVVKAEAVVEEAVVEEKPQKLLVMVVDDSITVRKVTSRLLQRHGMEVVTAKDGVDAVSKLHEVHPDVMLLDIEMPRMDGYELARHCQHSEELKDIPIIMITSRTGEKHKNIAMGLGVKRYLGKPYQETQLLENIHEVVAEVKA